MPIVSVIIPSYNHERYVGECIQSVLNQTFQDFEIIITDDGSTDRTVEVIEGFTDPRIKLFKHAGNKGTPVAANHCIRHATGKYVAALGSDDAWYPKKLELQVKYLDEHPDLAVVFSKVDWVDPSGNIIPDAQNPYKDLFNVQNRTRFEWLRLFFEHGNCLNHPSSLMRKHCLEEVGYLNPLLQGLHDFDLWIRTCFRYDILIMEEALVRYRWMSDHSNVSCNTKQNNIRYRFEYKQILDH
jgi:glycosyltransferase involved in cell wall biosynthesis